MAYFLKLLLFLLFLTNCSENTTTLDPISKALNYFNSEDSNFHKIFKDTVYFLMTNENFKDKESEGHFSLIEDKYIFQKDTIRFSNLERIELSEDEIKSTVKKFNPNCKVIIIQYEEVPSLLRANYARKSEDDKWMISINGYRSNNKIAVFQLHYQTDFKAYLGCEFVYSYPQKTFLRKECEFPSKRK